MVRREGREVGGGSKEREERDRRWSGERGERQVVVVRREGKKSDGSGQERGKGARW